jgi:lipid-binding SYLF domain-containing protein
MRHSEQLCGGFLSAMLIGFLAAPGMLGSVKDTRERLTLSATVMGEIMKAPDKGIPDEMLQAAHCVVVVPGLKKGAFIVSGQYGKGFVTCRRGPSWSSPAAIRIEGGGVGFQIGGSETDVVMLVMNARGAERLMSSQFTLGGEGEVAAGPVGRHATAETDGKFTAEILSWSRSRGVFAGVALKGATLRSDEDDNADLYGKKMSTKEVVDSSLPVPPAGRPLIRLLTRRSPTETR